MASPSKLVLTDANNNVGREIMFMSFLSRSERLSCCPYYGGSICP